ncbi:hypothetical protein D0T84_14240 [Dysgonomonas sp. 521]|uniref:tetratricopeptide repeat protein n=1 Tax=Dysgonomonas sp. 521 TaxID=2302932 RepID=UPI0013D6F54D|nr:hypothetical protein [Dysgonomonas sp. 521]NDV96063.1 hypothetical protein [Dysgonomonas sp. 521]
MKKIFLILFFTVSIFSYAQDNDSRAEALVAMAIGKEAEGGSLDEVSDIFKAATEISPDYAEIYNAWGAVIMQRAMAQKNNELCKDSFDKFRKATELKPDYAEAYSMWGLAIAYSDEKEKNTSILKEITDKFRKATEINPDDQNAYIYWGMTLLQYVQKEENAEYYRESAEKYEKALALGAKEVDIFAGKGWSYFRLGRLENDYLKYGNQITDAYSEAEKLGSQSAAYNLACYYSLVNEKDLAIKWLEKTIVMNYTSKMSELSKDRINKDEDFDNIRKDKRYKAILKKYFE